MIRLLSALSRALFTLAVLCATTLPSRAQGQAPAAPADPADLRPAEIQRLHSVYEDLIRTIEQEEAELQNLIVDKDVLLREVNHRSGNSLQIIASVMRMYRRETADDEVRTILDGLINRVIALSSTHTSLYSMTGRRDVPMDEIRGVSRIGGSCRCGRAVRRPGRGQRRRGVRERAASSAAAWRRPFSW